MAGHTAGDPLECFSIPLVLDKDQDIDEHGNPVIGQDGKPRYRCGFRIGGGIDQDNTKSPQGYPDKGIYVTYIHEGGPAGRCGLQVHDKILQVMATAAFLFWLKEMLTFIVRYGNKEPTIHKVNGHDFTLVTHRKAVEYIQRKPKLNMLVYRKGVPNLMKGDNSQQPQFQAYSQDSYQMQYQ